MGINVLTGALFKEMAQFGASFLASHRERINQLNVFPVPDGDTGTNMNLSLSSGLKAIQEESSDDLPQVLRVFMRGLMMGARGNSGVILSQLFRGFAEYLQEQQEVTSTTFAKGLEHGVSTAYASVAEPVEGTILTVAKDAARAAVTVAETETNICRVMEHVVEAARESLQRTPELLPILKEVGVIDSGGKGLLVIYEGFLTALKGEALPEVNPEEMVEAKTQNIEQMHAIQAFMSPEDITYGYCTEFMIELDPTKKEPFSEQTFREKMGAFGDSLLVAVDRDTVKVHVHTEYPGNAMTYAQQFGELMNIDIENMRKQHEAIVGQRTTVQQEKQKYAIITVASGAGLREMFTSLGANVIIEGGQTMNPSTEDFLQALEQIHAEHIFILPNNKNIILAAEQTKTLTDLDVTIIPTKTIPQGISALFNFDETFDKESNEVNMLDAIGDIKTGLVTYATRDTEINGLQIKKDSFMGLDDETIVTSTENKLTTTKQLLTKLVDEDDEIVTVFYGEDVTDDEVESLLTFMQATFSNLEMEVHKGNQPIYSFILMIE